MESSAWTSLEVVKLFVSALIPVAVLVVGYFLSKASTRLQWAQQFNHTLIERRFEIFSEMAPKLNRLYCFAQFLGRWKETTPEAVVLLKRDIDEIVYVNRIIFSSEVFDAYLRFMRTIFQEYSRQDGDALLRVPVECNLGSRRRQPWWEPRMEADFIEGQHSSLADVQRSYEELCSALREDLHATSDALRAPR